MVRLQWNQDYFPTTQKNVHLASTLTINYANNKIIIDS